MKLCLYDRGKFILTNLLRGDDRSILKTSIPGMCSQEPNFTHQVERVMFYYCSGLYLHLPSLRMKEHFKVELITAELSLVI